MKRILVTFFAFMIAATANAATLKIATLTPEGSQWMKDMRAGAKEILDRTEGRVQIKFYGGGVMGNDTKVLGKIRIGALQGGALCASAWTKQLRPVSRKPDSSISVSRPVALRTSCRTPRCAVSMT